MASTASHVAQCIKAFRRAGLLRGLSQTDATRVIKKLDPQLKHFYDREEICRPRQRENRLWILTKGRAEVQEKAGSKLRHITWLAIGDLVGELAYFQRPTPPNPAYVIASGPVDALAVSYDAIHHLSADLKTDLLEDIGRVMASKLDESRRDRADLTSRNERDLRLLRKFVPESGLSYSGTQGPSIRSKYLQERVIVYFSDVAGFSDMADRNKPDQLARIIRDVLDVQVTAIANHDGEIDKFIGDAVMAWWKITPDKDEICRQGCVKAFEAARRAVREVNKLVDPTTGERLNIRIGLHVGYAKVGNYGSKLRSAFTLIGSDVNLAARLEQARKAEKESDAPLGSIRVSEPFAALLDDDQRKFLPHATADLSEKHQCTDSLYGALIELVSVPDDCPRR